jgi:hypothetical protein
MIKENLSEWNFSCYINMTGNKINKPVTKGGIT